MAEFGCQTLARLPDNQSGPAVRGRQQKQPQCQAGPCGAQTENCPLALNVGCKLLGKVGAGTGSLGDQVRVIL